MNKVYKSFETERLILKPTTINDSGFILELMNTPKWIKNVGDRNVKTLRDAQKYIESKMLPQLEKLGYSNYTVTRKKDNQKIGVCGLYDREGLEGIDIGFAFLPEYEKKGYAFESANKIKEIAKSEFDLSIINAITIKENKSSIRLLDKLGFKFEKIVKIPDDDEELFLYKLIY